MTPNALPMIISNRRASQFERARHQAMSNARTWAPCAVGMAPALYPFMAVTIRTARHVVDAVRNVLPASASRPLFGVSLLLVAVPMIQLCRQLWLLRQPKSETLALAREFSC